MENQEILTNVDEINIKKGKKPKKVKESKPIKEKKIRKLSESKKLFFVSLFSIIGGSLILASAVYIGIMFMNPKMLSKFIGNSFTGELKDNFSFNVIHFSAFIAGFLGCGLIFIYALLVFYHIYINKVVKRYMWGATLSVSIVSVFIAITYTVLLSFVFSQIKGVTFAKDGDRYTFKPASWIAKAINTKYVDGQGAKLSFDNYVVIIQLISSCIGIIMFGISIFSFVTTRIIISPEPIKEKKLKLIELREDKKQDRLEKRKEKIQSRKEKKENESLNHIYKERRHKKNFINKDETLSNINEENIEQIQEKIIVTKTETKKTNKSKKESEE